MDDYTWIRGTIDPPSDGEYYIIIRAKQDMTDVFNHEVIRAKGEIEIDGDWWDNEEKRWASIGKNNPFWEVVAWGDVLKPPVPEWLRSDVRKYFGKDCKWTGKTWEIGE